jgi:hypothetical protein
MHLTELQGLHLVKRIDGFHDSLQMSGRVDVFVDLEAMQPDFNPSIASPMDVQKLLGNKNPTESSRRYARISIPAGELHFLEVGQVLLNGKLLGTLPGDHRNLLCTTPTESGLEDTKGITDIPAHFHHRNVLTQEEHWAGSSNDNQFLVFKYDGVEYVLPKMVVFKTFYCVSTTFVNAILSGPWSAAAQGLAEVEPPRETSEGTVWPIRPLDMNASTEAAVRQLALFLFSSHARRCANRVHSDRLMAPRGPWFNTANIPHDTNKGLAMRVHGYPLHRYGYRTARFLITRILGCDWDPADEPKVTRLTIEHLHDVPDPEADDASSEVGSSGFPKPTRVRGNPDARLGSGVDPSQSSDFNTFDLKPLEYAHCPAVVAVQRTRGSPRPGSKGHGKNAAPADRVSGGLGASGDDRPAKAEADQDHRLPSKHLEALQHVLDRLRDHRVIDAYRADGPTIGSPHYVFRNGQACWSLAGPKTGPEWITSQDATDSWPWVWEPQGPGINHSQKAAKKKFARALAVYRVTIGRWQGLLMDIECRPTNLQEGYRLFLVEVGNEPLRDEDMEPCLTALRESEGVLRDEESRAPGGAPGEKVMKNRKQLKDAFRTLQGKTHAKKHHGAADNADDSVRRQNARTLGMWLLKVASETQQTAILSRRAHLKTMKA